MESGNWWFGGPVLAVTLALSLGILVLAVWYWRRRRNWWHKALLALGALFAVVVVLAAGLLAFFTVMIECY